VVEQARFGRDLAGHRPPGGGQAGGGLSRRRVAVDREEQPPGLGRVQERPGERLQRMEGADSRAAVAQRREHRGVQAAGGVERHRRLGTPGEAGRHPGEGGVGDGDEQQVLAGRTGDLFPPAGRGHPPRPGGLGPAGEAEADPARADQGEAEPEERLVHAATILHKSPQLKHLSRLDLDRPGAPGYHRLALSWKEC
jgi:hypothetical protein